jgi:hypothetical protein
VALIIAAISAAMSLYFGLVPLPQTRVIYEAYLAPFVITLLLYFIWQIIRAPFALDQERKDTIEKLMTELHSLRTKEKPPHEIEPIQKLLLESLNPARISQDRLAAAIERQNENEHRARVSRILNPPGPMIALQVACESNQARLFVSNGGATAEFCGVFTISGLTTAKPGETFYCKWQHTYSKRTKIPKGQGFWIELATLKWGEGGAGSARWEINAVKEGQDGKDLVISISAIHTSCATSTPIARASDIKIEGSITADPDAENGIQKFCVVLKAFGAVVC